MTKIYKIRSRYRIDEDEGIKILHEEVEECPHRNPLGYTYEIEVCLCAQDRFLTYLGDLLGIAARDKAEEESVSC